MITAKNLEKRYGSFTAVAGVDFEIKSGEFYGFLGPNGAGKSSIMKMISCYFPPSCGTLEVNGINVTKDPSAIKAFLGVMPQENNLDPDFDVMENLLVYGSYFGMKKENIKRTVEELLEFTELVDKVKSHVETLSGGMKRRLMLARALINDPNIIILDEPTTGLDPKSRQSMHTRLKMLKEQGKTILLTTHYIEEAEIMCDRVAIVDQGKIVTVDSPEALISKHGGNLEHVYLTLTGRSLEG